MLSALKRLTQKREQSSDRRRRRFARTLERLENRQLLAADLDFSTFFPSTALDDGVVAATQDSQGNAYVVDYSYDPVTFEFESAAISKFSPTGELLWSQQTEEYAYDVGVDDDGLVYLISATLQDDLTVTPDAPQPTRAGGYDFYAIILDGNAIDADSTSLSTSELVFASYLGGSGDEDTTSLSLAVSPEGGFVIGGSTASNDFPTTNQLAVDSTFGGGAYDGVIADFQPSTGGSYELQMSTYLGDSGADFVRGVGVDASGTIHVVGRTDSINYPLTPDAIQDEFATSYSTRTGFVTRLNDDGAIQYSTFLGGGNIQDVAVDSVGNTYVVGAGGREGFPVTPGAYAPDEVFSEDGVTRLAGQFISKIDASGALEHSSWFQPSLGYSFAHGAQINLDGDRPVISGFDSGGSPQTSFFIRFDSDFSRIVDRVTVDSDAPQFPWIASSNFVDGSFYVVGFTDNAAFETTVGAIHSVKDSGTDGFVRKYTLAPPPLLFDANDSFDNGTPDGGTGPWAGPWELGSNTSFITTSGPNDGLTHAIIQRRGSLTRTVDTADVTDLNLSFASKLRSFENRDKAYVRVSPDGSNWTTLKTFGNGEDDNTYRDYSFDIPFDADTLWIRFEGGMSSRSADYWYVDTVSVTGEVIVTDPSPTASDDSYAVMEDGTLSIGAAGVLNNDSDPEGQSLTANLISGPGNGTLSLNSDGSFNYTPDADFDGTDQFTYAANDGISDSAAATVTIEVAPVNDAPVAFDDSFVVDQDTVLVVPANGLLANDGDVDGDALSIQPWSGPSDQGGQVTVNANGSFTYTPLPGFTGIDSFEYAASDGTLQSALATVMIEVAEANDNAIYVYDIQFDSRYWGWQRRAVFHVRSDSNFDGQGNSADQKAAGVEITVRFAGRTYSGVTDSNGVFRTGWIWNPGSGTYADVVDLALTDYTWDPLALDLEDDSNGDGLPDARL
ncbi:tandem-95 repeat protein [Crateriforma conspicua]|uniref:Beta-propeller repeat protein n=1 Tax=Crateriforma conspicua TaxID=2527996 RepID=A0A5C6FUN5_9PLAN|nr:tandem-95 repeat protein [Crateriforma conspicua]TWU65994.1 Beta-propeller repeat protein [Crateriforma conspicua]